MPDDFGLSYEMIDGKIQPVEYNPKHNKFKYKGRDGHWYCKIKLNIGPVDNPHSEAWGYLDKEEALCQMYAYRLCKKPEMAWYNYPGDPGRVTNKHMTWDTFKKLRPDLQERIKAKILEENMTTDIVEAEEKAWDALSRYKFQMFGYWAGIWVHLNRISGRKLPNPFKELVEIARR